MSAKIINFLKNWTLPVSMTTGALLYLIFSSVPALGDFSTKADVVITAIFPFVMMTILFATFCKVDYSHLRIRRWHIALLALQLTLIAFFILTFRLSPEQNSLSPPIGGTEGGLSIFNFPLGMSCKDWRLPEQEFSTFCEAMLVCIVAPCAAAAPVVTGKLGGDVESMTTYTLLSNAVCACIIPVSFTLMPDGSGAQGDGWGLFAHLARSTALILLLPMFLAWIVKHYTPLLHRLICSIRDLAFYLWALSLSIVSGLTVKHIIHAHAPAALLILLAAGSLAVCLLQFWLGRVIGRKHSAGLEAGQGLGQKNTAFAIWLAVTHLTPVSSVAPGCYILWQNIINSLEIATHRKRTEGNDTDISA